ncbi:MAG: PilZ domain-containing protein, partial [Bdellovibrionota bacterium]
AVVFNFQEWTNKEAVHLEDLKKVGYRGPILVIAKSDVSKAVRAAKATPNLVFLEKPFEMKDLLGIIRKMLLARAVLQRVHRRFATSQDAEVSFLTTGGTMSSRVRNLSKGGAYLEFLQPAPIKVGELVSVKLELKDVNRTYSMQAKIVWTSRTNSRGAGVGIEFVGRGGLK